MRKLIIFLSIICTQGPTSRSLCAEEQQGVAPILVQKIIAGYGAGRVALSGTGEHLGFVGGGGAALLDPRTGEELVGIRFSTRPCEVTDLACAFSEDGSLFAASMNECLALIDTRTANVLMNEAMPGEVWSIGALAFTRDNEQLVLGGQMTGVHFLNLRSRALNQSRALQGSVVGIESLQQSDTMAVAHFSGDIDLWTWRDDRIVGRLHECGSFSTSLAVGGRFLMAGCQGDDVDAWNTETGKHVGTIQGHAYIAQQFSVSDSGPILFAGSGPGRVENAQGLTTSELLLIDVVTQQTIASWKAHTAQGIYDTAITSDGRLFASCGYDGVINVWQR